MPEVALDESSSSLYCDVTGSFRLGNGGDSIVLLDECGRVVDSVSYGDCRDEVAGWTGPPVPVPRMGEVIKRTSDGQGFQDTDSSADWRPFREHRYGYTSFGTCASSVRPGNLTLFTSPDCTSEVIDSVIGSARTTIRLCTYEFSSWFVCGLLMDALDRGVSVRLLVDGSPSGGMDPRGVAALSVLSSSGATVRVVVGSIDSGVVRHVSALHAKYVVADDDTVVVMSENFVPSGVPLDHVFSNRGWGMSAVDIELAGFLSGVFDEDSRLDRPDVCDWLDDGRFDPDASMGSEEPGDHPVGMFTPLVVGSASEVMLVLSPDASNDEPFLRSLLSPESSLLIEQFQVDLLWTTRWSEHEGMSPLLEDVIRWSRSGVSSRLLLDSSWFNLERNEQVADALAAVYSVEGLDSQARLISPASPITVLHNKGLVVDSRTAVVSSNNWVYASFAKNRELAAIIDSPEAASYFTAVFDSDWYPDTTRPHLVVQKTVDVEVGDWVNLSCEECWDDRMLVDIAWDIHADGTIDSHSPGLAWVAAVPGDVVVVLTAKDAWGNEATERMTVHVSGGQYLLPPADQRETALPSATAGLLAAAMASLWIARRRASVRRRAPPRKLNVRGGG